MATCDATDGAAGVPGGSGPDLDVVLHGPVAEHPPRPRDGHLRLGALRPGDVAAVAVRRPVRDPDGSQPVRRPHVVRTAVPGPVVLDRSRRMDHVHGAVRGDRCGRDSRVPLCAPTTRLGMVGADRCRDVPAAPGGRLDEPGELPSRCIPRRVRRVRDLCRAGTQVASLRRVRRAVACSSRRTCRW